MAVCVEAETIKEVIGHAPGFIMNPRVIMTYYRTVDRDDDSASNEVHGPWVAHEVRGNTTQPRSGPFVLERVHRGCPPNSLSWAAVSAAWDSLTSVVIRTIHDVSS